MSDRKIITSHEYPPIPIRMMDWLAYFDGDEEGPQGWGPTEQEAIADLIENCADDDVEFIPLADVNAFDRFWSDNGDQLDINRETALSLARHCSLIIGGGAAPTFRVGFVEA